MIQSRFLSLLARQLNISSVEFLPTVKTLESISGRQNILSDFSAEYDSSLNSALTALNCQPTSSVSEVFNSLLAKADRDNSLLIKAFPKADLSSYSGRRYLLEQISSVFPLPEGFFLRPEKIVQLLESNPPENIINYLGYKNIADTLSKEDPLEIFAALRFLESSDWLNKTFFRSYDNLTPEDFVFQPIKLIALSDKWQNASSDFILKKRHNISHLKELGVIFMLPNIANVKGEMLRTTSLLFHYLYEVSFYSSLFSSRARLNPSGFSADLQSLLRGDVFNSSPPAGSWLVIQRYLEKDDPKDWRLSFPHLNTESLLYNQAEERLLSAFSGPDYNLDLSFWADNDWLGGFFSNQVQANGKKELISFDLLDVLMSLVNQKKYTYHQHEALWNKIFSAFLGRDFLYQVASDNLLRGYWQPPSSSV